ncbi:MAG: sugar nucleotide-binding protein [Eubacteriales bacterium]|nr:sugar nucleotide-binding protein [Eubacteriales bacterium]MDD4474648.1 sugar nucleotide-binding protein [Eubacteriales bacterium]
MEIEMKIILTGSTGFVGSRILYSLRSEGHDVICISSEILKGIITTERYFALSELIKGSKPEVIIHTAAISNTTYAQNHPEESYQANVELPIIMAKIAKENGSKLISCSSDQVYSGFVGLKGIAEDEELQPTNVYGKHKLYAEKQLTEVYPDAVSLRLTWMYDMPVYRTKTNENFVLSLYKSALLDRQMQFSLQDFRGLTYVRSVAENIVKTFALPGGVYNYGSENDQNMYLTACGFLEEMGLGEKIPELVKPIDSAKPRNLSMDCSKAKSFGINFEPTAEGIKKLISDYPGLF